MKKNKYIYYKNGDIISVIRGENMERLENWELNQNFKHCTSANLIETFYAKDIRSILFGVSGVFKSIFIKTTKRRIILTERI